MSKTKPRIITRTVTTEWVAVSGPVPCKCGHVHYGRKARNQTNLATQWHICENDDCGCNALRVALRTEQEDQP